MTLTSILTHLSSLASTNAVSAVPQGLQSRCCSMIRADWRSFGVGVSKLGTHPPQAIMHTDQICREYIDRDAGNGWACTRALIEVMRTCSSTRLSLSSISKILSLIGAHDDAAKWMLSHGILEVMADAVGLSLSLYPPSPLPPVCGPVLHHHPPALPTPCLSDLLSTTRRSSRLRTHWPPAFLLMVSFE